MEKLARKPKIERKKVKQIIYPHKKYELLDQGLKALAESTINILILNGDAGWGKSYTTEKYLKQNRINYAHINSYTTPLEFYNLLYQNRKRQVIVIDDTQGIADLKIIAMLKGACWSILDGKRKVSYHTTSKEFEKRELPNTFILEANIILIMNNKLPNFEPIIDRGILLNFNFSFKEKLDIFKVIQEEARFSRNVLNHVRLNCTEANKNLSIRTLIVLSKLESRGAIWQDFAKEMLRLDEDDILLLDLVAKSHRLEDACKEWCNETFHHRATFFRHYSLLGGKKIKREQEAEHTKPKEVQKAQQKEE